MQWRKSGTAAGSGCGASPNSTAAENAYALHAAGTDELAQQAGLNWIWNSITDSLMSRGGVLLPRHLITVRDAIGKMTSPTLRPQHWTIV